MLVDLNKLMLGLNQSQPLDREAANELVNELKWNGVSVENLKAEWIFPLTSSSITSKVTSH